MKHEPIFDWDNDTKTAVCVLTDGKDSYVGEAICHPDDYDMASEKTGYEIAFRRAKINALRGYRDQLKTSLKTLNQFYYTINRSKSFNEKSYENRMLQRQIRMTTFDLETTNEMIATEQQSLMAYIKEKDKFYSLVRTNRKIKANSN